MPESNPGAFEFLAPKARLRWGFSFVLVLVAHMGAAAAFVTFHIVSPPAQALPAAALLIDMTPLVQPTQSQPVAKPETLPEVEKAEVVIERKKPKKQPVEEKKPEVKTDLAASDQASTAPVRSKIPVAAAPAPPSYIGLLMAHAANYKRYPANALRLRHTGKVYVFFTIDRRGKVLSLQIERGTRYETLDRAALETVRRAEPWPAPPPEMPQDPVEIRIPIDFSLEY